MTDRDYVAEMNALCRAVLGESDSPLPIVAQDLVTRLGDNDQELLTGWLEARAADFLRDHLGHMMRSDRRVSRSQASRALERPRAFERAARAFEAGDASALGARFRAEYLIDDKGTRRRVADMTGPDHLFVATGYQTESKHSAFLARVHRAVAKKIGDRKTSEVYTEEQYAEMFGSPQRAGTESAA